MLKIKRKRAVFTIVKNESVYLPLWIDYYRKYFEDRDIYVLDHQSDDKSTENLPVNCQLAENELFQDNNWLLEVTKNFQKGLLQKYEQVLFTNVDQIIVPNPSKYSGLDAFIERNEKPTVRCSGWEMIHMTEEEPPLDPSLPITLQRKWWYKSDGLYSKVMLGSIPIDWTIGWHRATNHKGGINEDLNLIHTHRMDFDICKNKHIDMSTRKWHKPDIEEKKWGWHSLVRDETYYKWFYCIPAARTLDAPQSLDLFNEYIQNKTDSEVYEEAKSLSEPIPDCYSGMF